MMHHIDEENSHQLLSFFMAATVTILAAAIPSAMRHGARTVNLFAGWDDLG
jgi:hypothetical protein